MYQQEYFVLKNSGTYANILETIGLSYVLSRIKQDKCVSIKITDNFSYYTISLSEAVSESDVNTTGYFEGFPYIKYKDDQPPQGVNFIDYDYQKQIKENYRKFVSSTPSPSQQQKEEYQPKPHNYWDLLSNINKLKALSSYKKIFLNIFNNKSFFSELLKSILLLYSNIDDLTDKTQKRLKQIQKKNEGLKWDKVNALQLFNPQQGKGVNFPKAAGISMGGMRAFWIKEYLKIIGSYRAMYIKPVKVSNRTWDTKIYVLSPKNIEFEYFNILYEKFKPTVGGNNSLKLDIASILRFCLVFIENLEEYRENVPQFLKTFNPSHYVEGFYVAYLKKLGTSEAVTNLAFIQLPAFINIKTYIDCKDWIEILNNHLTILTKKSIRDAGIGLTILQTYRQFITSGDLFSLLDTMGTYSEFLMQELSKGHYNVFPFSKKIFEKFIKQTKEYYMNTTNKPLNPIFNNEGFKNIAKAIRNSTIVLQYNKHLKELYEPKYGIAQDLKRKSLYKQDLVEYLSEFIASYNVNIARVKERKGKDFVPWANVKQQDIEEIVQLIDEYGSNIIGRLLAAYGYAFDRKEKVAETGEIENPDNDSDTE